MLLVVFAIQGRNVVVFPRFLRFFLRFLSEVEGVFPHFLRLHLELHHLCKHFFKVFQFFWRGKFFFFSKYPQKSRIIILCVCVCVCVRVCVCACVLYNTNCKHRIKFFFLKWGEEIKIWKSLFDYVTILLTDF